MSEVITDNLDLWTSALLTKSSAGRGSNGNQEAYGIKKLRELILELAVRGKLVPQDLTDEPATVLLEKIASKKAQLAEKSEIKKDKSLPEAGEDEKPFVLPPGWEWGRLQDVSSYVQRGKGPQYADFGKVQVVSQKCVQWSGFDLSQVRYVDDSSLEAYKTERFLRKDDLLWNSTGTGTVGRINVVPEVAVGSLVADSHVTIIRPLLMKSSFIRCYISAPEIQLRIEPEHENSLVSGTTKQVELSLSAVLQLVIPVPPLAEQHRIVAKVDELMAQCDQLEQQQTHSLEAHQTLVETLLGTLTRAASHQELTEAWSRIADHFDILFTTEYRIDQLKQTILQLAVMGKLVPQDPRDEPASVFIERIGKKKARLKEERKIKRDKPLAVLADEVPFELPASWMWVRFEDVVDITSGVTLGRKISGKRLVMVPYLRVANVQRGYLDLYEVKEIGLTEDEVDKYSVIARDLLITEGGDWDKVGRTAVWRDELPRVAHQNHVFKARCFLEDQNEVWLERYLNSAAAREYFAGSSKQTTNLASINKTQLRGCPVAIPPLDEQHRIIAKFDKLIALCDALKARIKDAQNTKIHLADAIVEQAVNQAQPVSCGEQSTNRRQAKHGEGCAAWAV